MTRTEVLIAHEAEHFLPEDRLGLGLCLGSCLDLGSELLPHAALLTMKCETK